MGTATAQLRQGDKAAILFVVITWNSDEYVAACLDSLMTLESVDYLVSVVDNGSTDATADILGKYVDDRVSVVYLPDNVGTAKSRNVVLQNIPPHINYVCILDSDTVVNDDAILTLIRTLENDESIGIVGPLMHDSSGVFQVSGRRFPSLKIKLWKACPIPAVQALGNRMEQLESEVQDGLQDADYLLSACWVLPISVVKEVGVLDEHIFYAPEDVDYCLRVWQAGYRVVWCHNAQIVHEYQRLSKQRFFSQTNWEHIKGLIYFFIKHRYLFNPRKALTPRN